MKLCDKSFWVRFSSLSLVKTDNQSVENNSHVYSEEIPHASEFLCSFTHKSVFQYLLYANVLA